MLNLVRRAVARVARSAVRSRPTPPILLPLSADELRLPRGQTGPPRFDRRVCKLCDEADWRGDDWLGLLDDMGEGFARSRRHRKAWEWTQGLYALERLGLLHEDATAVGVGAGVEAVLFYLANRIRMVYATDIYGAGSFADETAHADMLTNPEKYSRIPFRRDHLRVLSMDGRKLEFPDAHFDIAFSFSSIEHFGGNEAAAQSVREMSRVVKPGGAVVLTTELVLNGAPHPEFFSPASLHASLVEGSGLRLIEDVDYSLSPETLEHALNCDNPEYTTTVPHVILRHNGVSWTSVCLVLEKPRD